jgi:hypothetical protein
VRASPQAPTGPCLQFAPAAWIKLQRLCHLGNTEVGGFGVVLDPSELVVSEFVIVKQRCSPVSVAFDDEAVAGYFNTMVDRGLSPQQFARIWLHTHPGEGAQPSGVDDETFERAFGGCDWSVMFILARGGQVYTRLRFGTGPGGELEIPFAVRWDLPLGEVDEASWRAEYKSNVVEEPLPQVGAVAERGQRFDLFDTGSDDDDSDAPGGSLEAVCAVCGGLECDDDYFRL